MNTLLLSAWTESTTNELSEQFARLKINIDSSVKLTDAHKSFYLFILEQVKSIEANLLPRNEFVTDQSELRVKLLNTIIQKYFSVIETQEMMIVDTEKGGKKLTVDNNELYFQKMISELIKKAVESLIKRPYFNLDKPEVDNAIKFLGALLYAIVDIDIADDIARKLGVVLKPANRLSSVVLGKEERVCSITEIQPTVYEIMEA